MLSLKQALSGIALIIALAVIGDRITSYDPLRPELVDWPSSTNLAIQFVRSPVDAEVVMAPDHRYGTTLAVQQYLDFGFIAAYTAFFLLVAWGMRRSPFELIRWAGWALIGTAIATAVCDLAENAAILATIHTPANAGWIRTFSIPKWIFASLAISLSSLLFFFWPRLPGWLRGIGIIAGVLFTAAGLYTLIGIGDAVLHMYEKLESQGGWVQAALIGALVFWACDASRSLLAHRGARAIPARAR
jgi:hypothetical protein